MEIRLTLEDDGSERVPYHSATLPLHAALCRLSEYPAMTCVCHWHDDREFILVRRGRMRYRVNGRELLLTAGQGVVVAPRQIHGNSDVNGEDAQFLCAVFRRSAIEVYPDLKASEPRADVPCLLLDAGKPADRPLLDELEQLAKHLDACKGGDATALLGFACLLTYAAEERLRNESEGSAEDRELPQLRRMLGFIQARYAERLTVQEIAQAGAMSESACARVFRRALGLSVVSYVNDYRVEQAMRLVGQTELTMTEIAMRCGFCSASYFAELFTRRTGMTPSTYRKASRTPARSA